MSANETKLQPLLEGEKQFVVPIFQRSYSWTNKERETLWNDFIELSESEMESDHSMGSMVTMSAHLVTKGVRMSRQSMCATTPSAPNDSEAHPCKAVKWIERIYARYIHDSTEIFNIMNGLIRAD